MCLDATPILTSLKHSNAVQVEVEVKLADTIGKKRCFDKSGICDTSMIFCSSLDPLSSPNQHQI
jgi:hypothetical protein